MTAGGAAPSRIGIVAAVLAALLFGASTPLAKLLLGEQPPVLLAGTLYLGSGVGLLAIHLARRARGVATAPVPQGKWGWLVGAMVVGGVVAPILLLHGLARSTASTASLLLNLESVFTALLAWTLGRENAGRRVILGMAAIVVAGAVLAWTDKGGLAVSLGALAVAAACLAWAVDNNLTQAVSSADPVFLAGSKGLVAGAANVAIALALGASVPPPLVVAGGLLVGFAGYGVSLVCFIVALRHVGAARTGAYFSLAPFVGAAASFLLLDEALSARFVVAAALMAVGVWLHLSERHEHEHEHEAMTHTHRHLHDEHHQHVHAPELAPLAEGRAHTHEHTHASLVHRHAHAPDLHHRHTHARPHASAEPDRR